MSSPDLNLLIPLDALLREGGVAGAARRLGLSPSAMSRALARLREATGDPLLVRAGRGLVPTPRALELRDQIGPLLEAATASLRPQQALNLASLERVFTFRAGEMFVESFGPALFARVAAEAPKARLRFLPKPNQDSAPLRDAEVDLETGVLGPDIGPEIRALTLYRDRFIGVMRAGHPLNDGDITPEVYAAAEHVATARAGVARGPVDAALSELGLERRIAVAVPNFPAALALARGADLIATVPERGVDGVRDGLTTFQLPFPPPEVAVALLWHPRLDADPAHRWLRACVRQVCAARKGVSAHAEAMSLLSQGPSHGSPHGRYDGPYDGVSSGL